MGLRGEVSSFCIFGHSKTDVRFFNTEAKKGGRERPRYSVMYFLRQDISTSRQNKLNIVTTQRLSNVHKHWNSVKLLSTPEINVKELWSCVSKLHVPFPFSVTQSGYLSQL